MKCGPRWPRERLTSLGPTDSNRATFNLRYPTDSDIIVSIQPASSSTAEGEDAAFTVTRTGNTSGVLNAVVTVEDPDGAMRGNHWAPALQTNDYRKDVTFAAGSSTATASFPTRPNVRDTGDLTITASVVEDPGLNFWVGYPVQADVAVTDDDTAMEVSLSVDRENVIKGEDLTFTLTRHGDTSEALEDAPFLRENRTELQAFGYGRHYESAPGLWSNHGCGSERHGTEPSRTETRPQRPPDVGGLFVCVDSCATGPRCLRRGHARAGNEGSPTGSRSGDH